jgi:uncharacterized Zn-finger protein
MHNNHVYAQSDLQDNQARMNGTPAPKSFLCQTCQKGFARRSDLSRHGKSPVSNLLRLGEAISDFFLSLVSERIHTGVRPHECNWPDCGKRFIQRSALTVHLRVHTHEKPHMCDHCSKVSWQPSQSH